MQETAGDALRETYDSWFGNALMGVQVENSDANNNDQKNIARVLNDKKSLVDELKDDLEKVEQRNADMAELDEHDEFLAEESARLKRSLGQAGGRPKKSRMSVLDLSSYLSCLCACRHVMLDVYVCVGHVVCVRCCRASPLQFAIGGQRFRRTLTCVVQTEVCRTEAPCGYRHQDIFCKRARALQNNTYRKYGHLKKTQKHQTASLICSSHSLYEFQAYLSMDQSKTS